MRLFRRTLHSDAFVKTISSIIQDCEEESVQIDDDLKLSILKAVNDAKHVGIGSILMRTNYIQEQCKVNNSPLDNKR